MKQPDTADQTEPVTEDADPPPRGGLLLTVLYTAFFFFILTAVRAFVPYLQRFPDPTILWITLSVVSVLLDSVRLKMFKVKP